MNIKFSQFPVLTEPLNSDSMVPVVQNNENYNIPASDIWDVFLVTSTNVLGSTYTLSLSDTGLWIRKYHTGNHIIYIPSNDEVRFPVDTVLSIRNVGTGTLTLTTNNLAVNINYNSTYQSNVLEANTSTQIIQHSLNSWDIA